MIIPVVKVAATSQATVEVVALAYLARLDSLAAGLASVLLAITFTVGTAEGDLSAGLLNILAAGLASVMVATIVQIILGDLPAVFLDYLAEPVVRTAAYLAAYLAACLATCLAAFLAAFLTAFLAAFLAAFLTAFLAAFLATSLAATAYLAAVALASTAYLASAA